MPIPSLRFITLLFLILATLSASPSLAIEVSEITVDFPLSEVLEIQSTESSATTQVTPSGPAAKVWRAPWEDDWYAYRQNILRGNVGDAEQRLERVLDYRKKRGIPNLYYPAAALLFEASSARNQGRYDDALKLIAFARELAPEDPAPHFQRAGTLWRQNQLRALSSLDALLEGWMTFFRDFRSLFPWALDFIIWILVAFTIASILTILLFLPRALPRIAHDLSHLLKVPQWLWLAAIPILFFVLLVLGMPPVLWVLLVGLTMLLHLDRGERIAVGLALFCMTALPLLVHVLALSHVYYGDSTVQSIYMAERGGEGARTLEELHRLRVRDPRNSQVLAAVGLILKRSERYREAERFLQQAMELTPDSPSVINNLGNVLFQTGRVEAAITHYRQALRYEDDPRVHYNLSQALRENLQLEEGEREFRVAQEKAPELASSLTARQQEGGQRVTVDIYGETKGYLLEAVTLSAEGRQWREALWSGIVPRVGYPLSWILFPAAGTIMFLGFPLAGRFSLSRRCRRCNRMHCPKCSQSSSDALCAQCRQIFLVRSGIDPASRVKKMMHILRFNRRRALVSRVATALLPGMGHVYLGVGWPSLILITISAMFWTKWVMWYGIFRNTTILEIQTGLIPRILFGILLGLFYLLALKNVGDHLEDK